MRKLTNKELRLEAEARIDQHCHLRGGSAGQKPEIYLVLDNLRSVYNIGAIFRTADAVGVKKIYLCGICAFPPRPDLHKTALGTEEYVEWEYVDSTLQALKKLKRLKCKIVALEQTDQSDDYRSLQGVTPRSMKRGVTPCKLALVVGNEVDGVSQEVLDLCDQAIDIPMAGWANSLNVTTALGVVLYSFIN